MHQHDNKVKAMIVHATLDREEEIIKHLINFFKDNKLGLKSVSFRWTTSSRIANAIRINYCNKDELRF